MDCIEKEIDLLSEAEKKELELYLKETKFSSRPTPVCPKVQEKKEREFDKQKLSAFMEEQAKNLKYDDSKYIPFVKKNKKCDVEKNNISSGKKHSSNEELSSLIKKASKNELNEVLEHLNLDENAIVQSKINDAVKCTKYTYNKSESDEVIEKLPIEKVLVENQAKDSTTLTLNNRELDQSDIEQIVKYLKMPKCPVCELNLANCQLTSIFINDLIECLKQNAKLSCINLETNKISGMAFIKLFEFLKKNNTVVTKLKLDNQIVSLGYDAESELVKMIEKNENIKKLSYNFQNKALSRRCDQLLMRNMEIARKKNQTKK